MWKVFNALETLNNQDFLDYIKKKHDAWVDDELSDNVEAFIAMVTTKYNNITKEEDSSNSKTKKILKNSKNNDNNNSKFLALLIQLLPYFNSNAALVTNS